MKRFFLLLGILLASPAMAQNGIYSPSVELPSVAAVANSSYGQYLHIQGFAVPGDGGGGYFIRNGFVCTPDGSTILKDKGGNCFFRQLNGTALISVDSVATLRASNFAGATPLQLAAFYTGGLAGGGTLTYDATDVSSSDNSCTIYVDTGGHRYKRQVVDLDITMCGAKADGVTDDAANFRQAFTVAATQPNKVLTAPGGAIKVNSTVTAAAGVSLRGRGNCSVSPLSACPTLIDGSGVTSGWIFDITTPNGTNLFNAPKYFDLGIQVPFNNNIGGCIRWNSLSGGFTNDASSQYYMVHPVAERVTCSMQAGASVQQIGFACYKCFDGILSNVEAIFGLNGADIEGSDRMTITNSSRFQGSTGPLVRFVRQGAQAFGNMDILENSHLLYPTDFGQSLTSFVELSATSDVLRNNHIEGNVLHGLSTIAINNGFSHTIEGNDIDTSTGVVALPCWLKVTTDLVNLTAINNGNGGGNIGSPCFNNGNPGVRYFENGNVNVRQVITHMGNAYNGDINWPTNSLPADTDTQLSPNTQQYYSPAMGGLSGNGAAASAQMVNGYFDLNVSGLGSSNYLDFGPTDRPFSLGTALTLFALASGSGTFNCSLTDNGVVKGYAVATLTAQPKWFQFTGFAGAITISAGARCYADVGATNAHLYAVTIGQ